MVPHVRFRRPGDGESKGIVEWASLKRAGQLVEQSCNSENPLGNKRNEGNPPCPLGASSEDQQPPSVQQTLLSVRPPTEVKAERSVPPIPNSSQVYAEGQEVLYSVNFKWKPGFIVLRDVDENHTVRLKSPSGHQFDAHIDLVLSGMKPTDAERRAKTAAAMSRWF